LRRRAPPTRRASSSPVQTRSSRRTPNAQQRAGHPRPS